MTATHYAASRKQAAYIIFQANAQVVAAGADIAGNESELERACPQ